MRSLIVAFASFGLVASGSTDYSARFSQFKADHGRTYPSEAEEAKRFGIFVENMKVAEAQAKLNPKAKFGVNAFSDFTAAEFKTYHNGNEHFKATAKARKEEVAMSDADKAKASGEAIDWRTKGAVTHVKNQGQCGSCWSFSTTGGIEGQWFLAGNPLTSLSEQELVSCDTIDDGCQGGIMQNAFKWLMENKDGKIVTAESYPYVSGMGQVPACDLSGKKFGAQISGHVDVKKHESDMAAWVYKNGPLSIAVDATSWQTYTGGILTDCSSTQVDHGVLIVGFDDNNSPPYWIIKNSWGPSWGEEGYIRVSKGSDQCLITYDPTSSTVSGGPSPTSAPTTTAGPTPSGSFTTKRCTTPDCTNCHTTVQQQNTCIKAGQFSFTATCATDALILHEYAGTDCSGNYNVTSQATGVCQVNFGSHGLNSYNEIVCPGGAPVPPSPPSPTAAPTNPPQPTTTSAPSGGTFTQKICSNSACTEGCQSHSFPQNQCLKLQGGGSAKAKCSSSDLTLTEYPTSTDCSGFSIPTTQPINKCVQDNSGSYLENLCSTSLEAAMGKEFHNTAELAAKVEKLMKRI